MRELSVWNVDRPETRELATQIRKVVDEFGDDRVLLAELVLPLEQTVAYQGDELGLGDDNQARHVAAQRGDEGVVVELG